MRLNAESSRGETIETKPAAILIHQSPRRHHRPDHLHRPYRLRRHYLCPIAARLWASHFVVIGRNVRSEEHTSELQSLAYLVCRLLLEKKKSNAPRHSI